MMVRVSRKFSLYRFMVATTIVVLWFALPGFAQEPTGAPDEAPVAGQEAPKPLRGGDFTMDQFESAQFSDQVKQLQAKKSQIRNQTIAKLENLLQQNPYYDAKADIYFRLAEFYWEEQHYQYLLTREQFDKQMDQFERGTLTTKPNEPVEDYAVSLEYYRKILQQFPDYARIDEVIYYLGRGALKAGKERQDRELTKEGVSHFQKLVQNYPNSRFIAESHLALAEHYFENNSLYYAKTNYEKIINNFPDSPMYNYALYKLGWVYFNLTEFRKAIETFQNVVQIVGKGTTRGMIEFKDQALNDLIVCYAEIPEGWREAREYFVDVIGEEEAYKKLRKLAELYVGQDRDEDAIALYTHFIEHNETDPNIPEYYDNIIAVLKKLNDFSRIEAEIRELIRFFDKRNTWYVANTKNAEAVKAAMTLSENNLLFLANHYHQKAQKENSKAAYEQAAADYAQFLELFPDSKSSYIINFYYAEILYDPIQDFKKAIEQYGGVIQRDKKGEYVEDAALGIIYAYQELMKDAKLMEDVGTGTVKVVKLSADEMKKRSAPIERTDLHELERGFVDASDKYVELLTDLIKDPEIRKKNPERGEKIPEIMFIAAQVYYNHGQFKEAITRLETLFEYDPRHKYAAYAVNTMLDCYVRLRYWDEINTWANKLIDAQNFSVKNKAELNRIRAIARAEKARDLTQEKKFDAAIDENMSVYKEFKKSNPELASTALYNVGVIHENAKRLPDAIDTYQRVVKEFPKEDMAPVAMFTIGVIYESQTQFEKAAETFEQMAKFEKHEDTPDAIKNAGLIREAMADYDGAIRSYEMYMKTFKDRDDSIEVELHIGRVYEMMNTDAGRQKAASHFQSFVKKYGKSPAQNERVVEALSRTGQVLKKIDKGKNRKDATRLFEEAIKTFARVENPAKSYARNFAAQAAFELAEYVYDDFMEAQVDASNIRNLKKTLTTKAELHQKSEAAYANILDYKSGGVTAGALFRIGKLYYDFSKALFAVPIPEELPPELEEEYIFTLEQMAAPLEEKSLTSFQYAMQLAQELKVYNDWSKQSAEYAAKVNPDSFPVSSEPAVQPNHVKDTLLSANFVRSLRRGDVEVNIIEIKETDNSRKVGTDQSNE